MAWRETISDRGVYIAVPGSARVCLLFSPKFSLAGPGTCQIRKELRCPPPKAIMKKTFFQPWLNLRYLFPIYLFEVTEDFSKKWPLGRFFLRVAMSVYMTVCLYVYGSKERGWILCRIVSHFFQLRSLNTLNKKSIRSKAKKCSALFCL